MVSADKEFDYVTTQIIKHVERSVDAFKMFAQLFSAIVGGSIWLSIQPSISLEAAKTFSHLSAGLVMLVTFIASFMIFDDYRAWYGFRTAQSELVPRVPKPRPRSTVSGMVMVASMIIGCGLFWWFNPFILAPKMGACAPSVSSPTGGQK